MTFQRNGQNWIFFHFLLLYPSWAYTGHTGASRSFAGHIIPAKQTSTRAGGWVGGCGGDGTKMNCG